MSGETHSNRRKQLAVLNAPRCQFTKDDGTGCGSPALKNRAFCYFHSRTPDGRKRKTSETAKPSCRVPHLIDEDAIRAAAMNVCCGLADKTLDSKRAGTLLYGLQIASAALRRSRSAAANSSRNHNMY